MPQLLLELFSEEIPARMQARAEADLTRLLMDKLTGAGFLPEGIKAFSTPRRLAAVVEGLPVRQPDVKEERKGPRVGSPEKAIEGFLRGAGLKSIDQARVVEDAKGAFYVADIEKTGADTAAVIARIVPEIIRAFPWPKSMRSGVSDLYWVRPLQRILCAFDGEAVPIDIDGVPCGRATEGHRFMAPGCFEVRRFEDYRDALLKHRVVLDREDRKAIIAREAKTLCEARNLELVDDAGLLEEVAGLAEWPVVVMGDMDPGFLDLPGEVIRLTMRTHQRYFAVRDPKTQKLAPHFITVANVEASDGGAEIARGNAKVLSARLNDARFFWEIDKAKGLEDLERLAKLDRIVFHQKLGSVGDKAKRIEALAVELAPIVGADVVLVRRAARLCKADLVTETVGEFPELQGQIGRQLYEAAMNVPPASAGKPSQEKTVPAKAGGTGDASIAIAIEDHYRPLGPNDRVPTDPVAVCVALADKLDSLVGFWAIGEKPTGSGDAYGLRRSALGAIRIVQSSLISVKWKQGIAKAHGTYLSAFEAVGALCFRSTTGSFRTYPMSLQTKEPAEDDAYWWISKARLLDRSFDAAFDQATDIFDEESFGRFSPIEEVFPDLLAFLADRLKVQLREQGKRHDLVDAVFALGDDDLVRIVARVEALEAFLKTDDGKNLLAGYKRAANILAAEDKKGALKDIDLAAPVDAKLLKEPAEKALAAALGRAQPAAKAAVEKEDFAAAMTALAALRGPVDAFMTDVLVNAPEPDLRANRLILLNRIRESLSQVADFSKIEG